MKKLLVLVLMGAVLLSGCSAKAKSITKEQLDEVVAEIKNAYGEDYHPDMVVEAEQLKEIYGIDSDLLEHFVVEGPLMTMSTDMLFALVAKAGKVDEVKAQVEAYQTYLINDSFQYPMNMARVNASQIVVKDNAIFFIVLGKYDDRNEVSEADALEFAKAQIQIAVDVINAKLK